MIPAIWQFNEKGYGEIVFESCTDPRIDTPDAINIKVYYAIDFTKYKLVPIEPTASQIKKGMEAIRADDSVQANETARHAVLAYKAMIAGRTRRY